MAATLLRHSSFSQSWYQPLLKGWCGGCPGWDHLLSCFCSAQGWAGPRVPAAPCRKEGDIQDQAGSSAQPVPGQGRSLPGQALLVLELSRWFTISRAAIFRSIWHMKCHVWALLHVEAHEFLQRCCLNYLKASCSTECTGFPVLWGADGVSKKPLQGKWSSNLHHAFPKNAIGLGFLKQQARIKLQSINVSIQLFQLCRLLFLSCTK